VVAGSPGANAVTVTINGVSIGLSGSNVTGGTDTLTVNDTVTAINAYSSQTGVTAYNDTTRVRLVSNVFGSGGNFTASLKVDSGTDFTGLSGSVASTGLTTLTVSTGTDIVGTINGQAGIGQGSVLSSADGNVRITYYQGSVNKFTSDATATQLGVNYANAQTYQIGNNAGDTMGMMIRDLRATALGRGTIGLNAVTDPLSIASSAATATFSSLSDINVTTTKNAADAVRIIDNAIGELNNQRAVLGSFLSSTLTPTQDNLAAVTESTTSLQSTLVETNYAEEIANQTKLLVQAEVAGSMLSKSGEIMKQILGIIR
jgi:flagellin